MIGLPGIFPVHAANLPDRQELMQVLGTEQKEFVNLDQGKIVSFDVAEGDEKELAASFVIYLPATPSKIIQFINKKAWQTSIPMSSHHLSLCLNSTSYRHGLPVSRPHGCDLSLGHPWLLDSGNPCRNDVLGFIVKTDRC
jgi:hypothetical protein